MSNVHTKTEKVEGILSVRHGFRKVKKVTHLYIYTTGEIMLLCSTEAYLTEGRKIYAFSVAFCVKNRPNNIIATM